MSTKIDIPAVSSAVAKGVAPLIGASKHESAGRYNKGFAIFDFLLRLGGLIAAATMGTSDETLPFFTQFSSNFSRFFVIAMAIVGGYLVTIIRPHAIGPRLLFLILDMVALTLNTAAADAAAAIVYLAHNGNTSANWLGICQQFGDFCQKVSGAVVASFVSVLVFVFLIVMSG